MSTILLTGGAGYIGSHTCVELLQAGYEVVVLDNCCNSHPESLRWVEKITGRSLTFVRSDIRDQVTTETVLRKYACNAVIHFAGLKSVGDSNLRPVEYYDNNFVGTVCLLQAMQAAKVKTLVFSSSATVYGKPQVLPLTEDHPLSATNPYDRSKLMIEDMLRDLFQAELDWRISFLRYFNPVGAHPSGLIGEDPLGTPNNLMPFVAQVVGGRREHLSIWGSDYSTPDGTGVRDYIHVLDLAIGHVRALESLVAPQCTPINLGTGRDYSVLEVVKAFESVSGLTIPYILAPRRLGDVAACYADPSRAHNLLGWQAFRSLNTMCRDHWHWQQCNPMGYVQKELV